MRDHTVDSLWMALAVGALEPGDAVALLRGAGPLGPLRLATLQVLADLPAELVQPALTAALGPAPVLGFASSAGVRYPPQGVHLGERVRLRVRPPGPAGELRPMLLRQSRGNTTRLLPTIGAPWPTLDTFLADEGDRVIDLVVGEPRGRQTLILGLLSAQEVETPWPAGDPRDARIAAAVRGGHLPGAVLQVDVG